MHGFLCFLTFGIILFHLPSDFLIISGTRSPRVEEGNFSFATILIGHLIAVVSGFIGIYTEVILEENIPFWVSQTW